MAMVVQTWYYYFAYTGDDFEVESCTLDGRVLPCEERQQLEGSGFIDADDEDC